MVTWLFALLIPLGLLISEHPASEKCFTILRTLSHRHVQLTITPCEYLDSIVTIIFAMLVLVTKHLGLAPRFNVVAEDGTVPLPELGISAPITVVPHEVEAYRAAVAASDIEGVSSAKQWTDTPLLLLAGLTAPLLPSLLLFNASPIKPLGSVNVRNTFILHRPKALRRLGTPGDTLGIKAASGPGVEAEDKKGKAGMQVDARMGGDQAGPGRRMKKGVEYDSVITVSESERNEDVLFSFIFTALASSPVARSTPLHASAHTAPPDASSDDIMWENDPIPLPLAARFPRRWAALSKDYNPIHISPFLARLFGFKRCIAHGNAVLGAVVERATDQHAGEVKGPREGGHQRQLDRLWSGDTSNWLIVQFKRPVFVPSSPKIRWGPGRAQVYEEQDGQVKVLVDIHAGEGVHPPNLVH